MSIMEFLLARIAEDEALAKSRPDSHFYVLPDDGYEMAGIGPGYVLAAAPARVLAECSAKREILDDHAPYYEGSDLCGGHDGRHTVEQCYLRRVMAGVYADHPDFDPAWLP